MDAPNTNSSPLPPDEDLTEVKKPTSLLVAQFFLFPLIIIGFCVAIFVFFGYLTYDQRTATNYVDDIKSGSGQQRWQAAFELSNSVTSNPDRARNAAFIENLITAYKNSPDEDIKVRGYLALVFGKIKERSAVPLLVEELSRAEQTEDDRLEREREDSNSSAPLSRRSREDLVQESELHLVCTGFDWR